MYWHCVVGSTLIQYFADIGFRWHIQKIKCWHFDVVGRMIRRCADTVCQWHVVLTLWCRWHVHTTFCVDILTSIAWWNVVLLTFWRRWHDNTTLCNVDMTLWRFCHVAKTWCGLLWLTYNLRNRLIFFIFTIGKHLLGVCCFLSLISLLL